MLEPLVLEVAMRYRNDMLAQPQDLDYNRCHRHTAYRQYILWIHGYLGVGNRQVIAAAFGQSETDTRTPQDNMWDLFKDDLVK